MTFSTQFHIKMYEQNVFSADYGERVFFGIYFYIYCPGTKTEIIMNTNFVVLSVRSVHGGEDTNSRWKVDFPDKH